MPHFKEKGVQYNEEDKQTKIQKKQKRRQKIKDSCRNYALTIAEFILCLICLVIAIATYHLLDIMLSAVQSYRCKLLTPITLVVSSIFFSITYLDLISWRTLRPITYYVWIMVCSAGFLLFCLYAGVLLLESTHLITIIGMAFAIITAFVFLADLICLLRHLKRYPHPHWVLKRRLRISDLASWTGDSPFDEPRPLCTCKTGWGEPCTCDAKEEPDPTCGCGATQEEQPCPCCECAETGEAETGRAISNTEFMRKSAFSIQMYDESVPRKSSLVTRSTDMLVVSEAADKDKKSILSTRSIEVSRQPLDDQPNRRTYCTDPSLSRKSVVSKKSVVSSRYEDRSLVDDSIMSNPTITSKPVLKTGVDELPVYFATVGQQAPRQSMAAQSFFEGTLPRQSMAAQSYYEDALPRQSMAAQSFYEDTLPRQSMAGQSFFEDRLPRQSMGGQSFFGDRLARQSMAEQSFFEDRPPRQSMAGQSFFEDRPPKKSIMSRKSVSTRIYDGDRRRKSTVSRKSMVSRVSAYPDDSSDDEYGEGDTPRKSVVSARLNDNVARKSILARRASSWRAPLQEDRLASIATTPDKRKEHLRFSVFSVATETSDPQGFISESNVKTRRATTYPRNNPNTRMSRISQKLQENDFGDYAIPGQVPTENEPFLDNTVYVKNKSVTARTNNRRASTRSTKSTRSRKSISPERSKSRERPGRPKSAAINEFRPSKMVIRNVSTTVKPARPTLSKVMEASHESRSVSQSNVSKKSDRFPSEATITMNK